jgi:ligand-binding sensor domain-containing protein
MQRRLLLFFPTLFCIAQLWAQNPIYRTYNSRHGLPSTEVYDVLQDQDGYIWFTTDHGLARFDGYQFKTFTVEDGMPESSVFYLFPASDGTIWFTSLSGKLGYIIDNTPVSYRFNDTLQALKEKLAFRIFPNALHVDSAGSVYFGTTSSGVFRISNTGEVSNIDTVTKANSLKLFELEGTSVLGTVNNLDKITQIVYNNGLNEKVYPQQFNMKKGRLFIEAKKTKEGKVFLSTQHYLMLLENDHLRAVSLDAIIITFDFDKTGNLWVSTLSNGIYVFDTQLTLINHYFPDKTITGFLEDHEGGYWFTTLTEGVIYIPYKDFRFLNENDGLPDDRIVGLDIGPNNELWFATHKGHYGQISDNKIYKLQSLNIPDEASVSDILFDKIRRRLFISSNHELFEVNPSTGSKTIAMFSSKQHRYEHNRSIKTMLQRSGSGEIWRGHYSGISSVDQSNKITYVSWEGNLFTKRIECLAERNSKELWIGTTNGLYLLNDNRYIYYGDYYPLLKQRITTILYLGDTLWVGTRGNGLYCLADRKLVQFSTKDGLVSNDINQIKATNESIYIGTNRGLSVMQRKKTDNQKATITNLVSGSGLAGNEITALALSKNALYAATPEGISIINNTELPHLPNMPIHITAVQIGGEQTDVNTTKEVPYASNQLTINYFAISYRIIGKHTYRHRLIGLDDDWIINQQTTAQYPYLPPGNYTFEVQVLQPNGQWGTTKASYSFLVLRPFWMKWWFFIATSILVISLLMILIRWYYKKANRRKQLEAELNLFRQEALTNQMNPHFLFNTLNTVQRYILENDKVSSSKYLTKFSGLMRTILNNSQEHQISIENEINALELYLDLESARFKDTFSYTVFCSPEIDPKTTFIPVFLIQPLVENALRHGVRDISYHGTIAVDFLKDASNLIMRITDNGIGREAAASNKSTQEKTSLGISIIQKRLSLISKNTKNKSELYYKDIKDKNGKVGGTVAEIVITNHFNSPAYE